MIDTRAADLNEINSSIAGITAPLRKFSRSMSDPNAAFKIPQFLRNFQTFEAKFSQDDEIRTIGPPTMHADKSFTSPIPLDGRK